MSENKLLSYCLRWGFIIAGIDILIMLVLYAVDVSMMASIPIGILTFVIFISLIVYAGLGYRKLLGGFADFKTMLVAVFLVMAISGGVGVLFQTVMYTVIDPTIPEQLKEASLETTENIMMYFNLPPDAIDEALENTEEELEEAFTPQKLIISFLFPGLIWFLVLSLIIAAIIKKNKPIFGEE